MAKRNDIKLETRYFGLTEFGFLLPHWFLIALSATFAAVPWIRQLKLRFSLRTLLVATTLIAVVLGLITYAARK